MIFAKLAGLRTMPVTLAPTLVATYNWEATGWNIHLLYQSYPALARRYLDTPACYGLGGNPSRNPVLDGFATTATLKYESCALFASDVGAGMISPVFTWVMYDPEKWDKTPVAEQEDPWASMRRFGDLAHAHGLKVIMAPARDLGLVTGSLHPKDTGEPLNHWYLRTGLAGTAATCGDLVSVQSQAVTLNLAEFKSFLTHARDQARAANPCVKVFGGVSTNYGTARQMATAAKSVAVDGYWVNILKGEIAKAASFFRQAG